MHIVTVLGLSNLLWIGKLCISNISYGRVKRQLTLQTRCTCTCSVLCFSELSIFFIIGLPRLLFYVTKAIIQFLQLFVMLLCCGSQCTHILVQVIDGLLQAGHCLVIKRNSCTSVVACCIKKAQSRTCFELHLSEAPPYWKWESNLFMHGCMEPRLASRSHIWLHVNIKF